MTGVQTCALPIFLFLNLGRAPTEEEQFKDYRAVVEALAPSPVVIRTLDLGGDKPIAGNAALFPRESNPFMGFRAIRWCLENRAVFKDQLRAILRASAFGKVRMMYPMISGADELSRANAILEECRGELRARGAAFRMACSSAPWLPPTSTICSKRPKS